jgi:membrane-associated phospholipid phosphatase
MTELTPTTDHRLAVVLGLLFHPYTVAVVTLLILLRNIPTGEALLWILLVIAGLIAPLVIYTAVRRRREKYVYQRSERGGIYLIGWIGVVVILLVTVTANAPRILVVCIATLGIWLPLQRLINQRFTKVSTHTGVITACVLGLILSGHLDTPPGFAFGVMVIILTAWARVQTSHHTPFQVLLGIVVGALPVLITFPTLLPNL